MSNHDEKILLLLKFSHESNPQVLIPLKMGNNNIISGLFPQFAQKDLILFNIQMNNSGEVCLRTFDHFPLTVKSKESNDVLTSDHDKNLSLTKQTLINFNSILNIQFLPFLPDCTNFFFSFEKKEIDVLNVSEDIVVEDIEAKSKPDVPNSEMESITQNQKDNEIYEEKEERNVHSDQSDDIVIKSDDGEIQHTHPEENFDFQEGEEIFGLDCALEQGLCNSSPSNKSQKMKIFKSPSSTIVNKEKEDSLVFDKNLIASNLEEEKSKEREEKEEVLSLSKELSVNSQNSNEENLNKAKHSISSPVSPKNSIKSDKKDHNLELSFSSKPQLLTHNTLQNQLLATKVHITTDEEEGPENNHENLSQSEVTQKTPTSKSKSESRTFMSFSQPEMDSLLKKSIAQSNRLTRSTSSNFNPSVDHLQRKRKRNNIGNVDQIDQSSKRASNTNLPNTHANNIVDYNSSDNIKLNVNEHVNSTNRSNRSNRTYINSRRRIKNKDAMEDSEVSSPPKRLPCSICLEPMNNPSSLDNCEHEFCKECIDQWALLANTCPLCKHEFKKITYWEANMKQEKKVRKRRFKYEDEEEEPWYNNCAENCMVCGKNNDEHLLLVCDKCTYNICHTYCAGLDLIPDEDWICPQCEEAETLANRNSKKKGRSRKGDGHMSSSQPLPNSNNNFNTKNISIPIQYKLPNNSNIHKRNSSLNFNVNVNLQITNTQNRKKKRKIHIRKNSDRRRAGRSQKEQTEHRERRYSSTPGTHKKQKPKKVRNKYSLRRKDKK